MLSPHYEIQLSFEERQRLEALLRAGKTEQRVAQRAALILLADRESNNQQIAHQVETSRNWVQKWRKRFAQYAAPQPKPGQKPDPLAHAFTWTYTGKPLAVSREQFDLAGA